MLASSSSSWRAKQRYVSYFIIIIVLNTIGESWSWTTNSISRQEATPLQQNARSFSIDSIALYASSDPSSESLSSSSSSSPHWWSNLLKWNRNGIPQTPPSKSDVKGEIRIRRVSLSDIRATTDLLTEAFFRNNTNMFTYAWEWWFTLMSLEGDFPQPYTQRYNRQPHDILLAEYVLVPSNDENNNQSDTTTKAATVANGKPSRRNKPTDSDQGVVVVEAVGMVQLDGRRGRIPWKTPPSRRQRLDAESLASIGPQPSLSPSSPPEEYERPVYLCNLAVRESWRRRGVATQLIQASERLVRQEEESYQQATHLCLKVRRNTPVVIAMYQKLGYAIFEPPLPPALRGVFLPLRLQEDGDEKEDAIWWMSKSLEDTKMIATTTTQASISPDAVPANGGSDMTGSTFASSSTSDQPQPWSLTQHEEVL